jgi:hypothetical protein
MLGNRSAAPNLAHTASILIFLVALEPRTLLECDPRKTLLGFLRERLPLLRCGYVLDADLHLTLFNQHCKCIAVGDSYDTAEKVSAWADAVTKSRTQVNAAALIRR